MFNSYSGAIKVRTFSAAFSTRIKWLSSSLALCIALTGVSADASASNKPAFALTHYGLVRGVDDGDASGTRFWKGIPFAKPPMNELRWKATQPPAAWRPKILNAQHYGNACMQTGRIYGPGANNTYDDSIANTLNTTVGSEDCLTLNVWRPDTTQRNLPVIVYLYGGSNVSGYSADPVYDGAALAKSANAIVVTLNYRLGVLGFFNASALKTGTNANEDSGNFALLDVIQALKFIKRDIKSFGGNPSNVTLMGQSAGAINTWALLTSPLAENLFQKAIPLSGGLALAAELPPGSIATLNPAAAYAKQADNLLYTLIIADGLATDAVTAKAYADSLSAQQIAEYLRGKSGDAILQTVLKAGLGGSGPIPDGSVVPLDPIAEINQGRYNKMPVLAGSTQEEAKLFPAFFALLGGAPGFVINDAARFSLMKNFDPNQPANVSLSDIIHPSYLPIDTAGTGYNARAGMLTHAFLNVNRDSILNAIKSQQDNVWYYQFRWAQEPAPWNDIYGAAHGFDLAFLFGNFGPAVFSNVISSEANKEGRLALSAAMMKSIGHFVWCGDPNHTSLGASWNSWPNKLIFDATQTEAVISVE